MSRKTLKVLFHMGAKEYKTEYDNRYNDADTIHLSVNIGENAAFICQTPEIYKQIISIERLDKGVESLTNTLPQLVISQFTSKCLIDEILLTNNIEGVHSTRKEIGEILQDLSTRDKRNRFVGLVAKYAALEDDHTMSFKSCQDIRKVYDDIFYEEIKATDPDNLPDGELFRRSGVEVQSATQKVIHKGISPESKIIDSMNQSLNVLNDDDIDIFIRISVFHYLFGYIHPFYDGNGRTSRFISSYLLSRQLNPLIGFRLSYTIKENISKYYKAFEVCNDPHNKAELTPFVEMFLNLVEISLQQLLETLEDKKFKWDYYCQRIVSLPNAEKTDISHMYELLIQAALFSNIGISREELLNELQLSENTVRSRLKLIPANLLIENRQRGRKYYLLDLDAADKIFEDS
ncbi:Fic family protein [Ruminococcus flavefaciens]|uniref:Fic family protein n=1 Tax=Ruminococcus flavefaciens TaxID=1265 RepID=A0A1M7IHN3_RUMFL|nr:Fic family protein [Ruminococcus flavefaciens]SHM40175.1 Fic family protein [Ruminococcus flavefaciens]